MIYQHIDVSAFRTAFHRAGRGDNFSYDGLGVLFEYLEPQGDMELDVIALCCDFAEEDIEDVLEHNNLDSLAELEEKTVVLKVDSETVIYQVF